MKNGVGMFPTYITNIVLQLQIVEVNIGDDAFMEGFPNQRSDTLKGLKPPIESHIMEGEYSEELIRLVFKLEIEKNSDFVPPKKQVS